jgi:hypothetical protein
MVWNAGVGPWWAATAEIFISYGFKFHCLSTPAEHANLLITCQILNVLSVTSGVGREGSEMAQLQTMHPVLLA